MRKRAVAFPACVMGKGFQIVGQRKGRAMRLAQEMSQTYRSAFAEVRAIGLSHSAGEKLARFVLDWAASQTPEKGSNRYRLTLPHEEIAQMIGATRESVTRLFADFKKKQVLLVRIPIWYLRTRQSWNGWSRHIDKAVFTVCTFTQTNHQEFHQIRQFQ